MGWGVFQVGKSRPVTTAIRVEIKEISAEQTWPLRSEVLRPGMPLSACIFPGDDAPDTHHFGMVDSNGDIVGIVSALRNSHPSAPGSAPYQIRAMAISSHYRGQGVGRLLLAGVENYLRSRGSTVVWANARSSAVGFYQQQGYQVVADEFVIEGVGPHYLVTKLLVTESLNNV